MFELIVYLAFGLPGQHDRWTHETVAVYASYEACDAARWQWHQTERLPNSYAPAYSDDEPQRKGWFYNGIPNCERRALIG